MKRTARTFCALLAVALLTPSQVVAAYAAPGSTSPAPSSTSTLVLNEINSSPDDWVELMNTGSEALDLSGFELRDNSDDHR